MSERQGTFRLTTDVNHQLSRYNSEQNRIWIVRKWQNYILFWFGTVWHKCASVLQRGLQQNIMTNRAWPTTVNGTADTDWMTLAPKQMADIRKRLMEDLLEKDAQIITDIFKHQQNLRRRQNERRIQICLSRIFSPFQFKFTARIEEKQKKS